MIIRSVTLTNYISEIISKNDMIANVDDLKNESFSYEEDVTLRYTIGEDDKKYYEYDFAGTQLLNAYIKSGGSMEGNISTRINNVIKPNVEGIERPDLVTKDTVVNNINPTVLFATSTLELDLSDITDLINHSPDGRINYGDFVINKNVNPNKPLIEARSQFVDQSKFFGSDYFYAALGISKSDLITNIRTLENNTNRVIRFLGDSYVEQTLLATQLAQLRKDALYLRNSSVVGANDAGSEVKSLLDNSIAEIARLNLDVNQIALNGLSQSQIATLDKDVVLFTGKELNNEFIIVPTLYLAQATRNNLLGNQTVTTVSTVFVNEGRKSLGVRTVTNSYETADVANSSLAMNSGIFAAGNVTINAASAAVVNNGSIISGNGNITIAADSLINKSTGVTQAEITSVAGSVAVTATNDIKNIGANITANDAVNLTSINGDIVNSAVVQTNDATLLSSNSDAYVLAAGDSARTAATNAGFGAGSVSSRLVNTASIKGGSVTINAGNDFTNSAATITAAKNDLVGGGQSSGNVAITAGDDVTIETLEIRNRSESSWGSRRRGGTSVSDVTTNIGSGVDAGGSITLSALGTSPQNSNPTNSDYRSNINIKGSDLTSANNIIISAKDDVTIQSAQDSSYSFSAGGRKGKSFMNTASSTTQISSNLTTTNNGNISINAGVGNSDVIGDTNSVGSIAIIASKLTTKDNDGNAANNVGSGNISLTAKEDVVIMSALNTSFAQSSSSKKGGGTKKTTLDILSIQENVSSELNSNNNINLTSGDDSYIIASNLTGKGNGNITTGKYVHPNDATNITYNSDATLNILSATDSRYKYHMDQTIKRDYAAIAVAATAAVAGAALTGGASVAVLASAGASGGMIGAQAKKSKTNTELTYDAVQKASELKFNNNLTIESGSDVNIVSSNLTSGINPVADGEGKVTINVGKITDASNVLQTVNADANLNVATIADVHVHEKTTKKTHANYAALAVTSFAVGAIGAYAGQAGQGLGNSVGYTAGNFVGGEALGMATANILSVAFQVGFAVGVHQALVTPAAQSSTRLTAGNNSLTTQTQAASNIAASGDVSLTSTNNLTLSASNVSTASGDINLSAERGDVNIVAGINSSTSVSGSETMDFSGMDFTHTDSSVGLDFNQAGNRSNSTITTSTLASSNIISSGAININSGSLIVDGDTNDLAKKGKTNLLASNLIAQNNINIDAKNDINIKSQEQLQQLINNQTQINNSFNVSVGNSWLQSAINAGRNSQRLSDGSNGNDSSARTANYSAIAAQTAMDYVSVLTTAPTYGFYAALTYTHEENTTETTTYIVSNKSSNILSYNGDINLTTKNNLDIKGSNLEADAGDINLTAKNITIESAQNTVSSRTDFRSSSVSESVSNNLSLMIPTFSHTNSSSTYDSVTNVNSTLTAINGKIKLNAISDQINDATNTSFEDSTSGRTLIAGANLLGQDIEIITKNLSVISQQNTANSRSDTNGYSIGNDIGFNFQNNRADRKWVDDQTSIIGTNAVNINVEQNTNLVGSMIANIDSSGNDAGNLTLNTRTLTYSDLNDYDTSKERGFGIRTALAIGYDTQTNAGLNSGVANSATNITYNNQGTDKQQITRATIGSGTITLSTTITRDAVTGEITNIINGKTAQEILADTNSTAEEINSANATISINRDINKAQEIMQDQQYGGYNINLQISHTQMMAMFGNDDAQALLSAGRRQNAKELKQGSLFVGNNLKTVREAVQDNLPYNIGTVLTQPISAVEGTVFTFLENGSYNYKRITDLNQALGINQNSNLELNLSTPKNESQGNALDTFANNISNNLSRLYYYQRVDSAATTTNYGLNGIMTNFATGFSNYQLNNADVTWRYNPTHGFVGDLIESGLGKVASWTDTQGLIAMNSYGTQDIFERRNIENATNLYHSQGTIIGRGAMELYAKTFGAGYDLDGNILRDANGQAMGPQYVNQSQRFVAVGPAVLKEDWYLTTTLLGKDIRENAIWNHDQHDPIINFAAPSNLVTDITGLFTNEPINSPIYIPNLFTNIPIGIWNGFFNIKKHDVTNEQYSQYLNGKEKEKAQNNTHFK